MKWLKLMKTNDSQNDQKMLRINHQDKKIRMSYTILSTFRRNHLNPLNHLIEFFFILIKKIRLNDIKLMMFIEHCLEHLLEQLNNHNLFLD